MATNINVERINHNGHLILSVRVTDGSLFKKTFIGYSKSDAMRLFRQEMKAKKLKPH